LTDGLNVGVTLCLLVVCLLVSSVKAVATVCTVCIESAIKQQSTVQWLLCYIAVFVLVRSCWWVGLLCFDNFVSTVAVDACVLVRDLFTFLMLQHWILVTRLHCSFIC